MSTNLMRLIVEEYGRAAGVNPFSHAFVWNPSFAPHRFKRVSSGGKNLLEVLLRCGLTNEERALIFPGKFDLGSHSDLKSEDCSDERVAEELNLDYGKTLTASDLRHTIDQISAVTGVRFQVHRELDRATASKVLKLFWRLKGDRRTTVLSMIHTTDDGSSAALELTNPYPLGTGDLKRQLFADVKAYLSAEIDPDRLDEIDATFEKVRDALDAFIDRVNTVLKLALNADGTVASAQDVYERFAVVSKAWLRPRAQPFNHRLLPLDQQLYIHMSSLDFLNFAAVNRHLRTQRIGQVDVETVQAELRQMAGKFSVRDLFGSAPHLTQFAPTVGKALGRTMEIDSFLKKLPDAGHCLEHYLATCQIPTPEDADALTTAAAIVFAIVISAPDCPPYRPYIQAQGHISGSIRAALRKPVNSAHEEYERVCRYAIDWYKYALWGCSKLHEVQCAFELGMIELVVKVCKTHDTLLMGTLIHNLEEYATHGVTHVPAVVEAKRAAQPPRSEQSTA